jgi:4-methylaminobutanoate oxidase (formaldehyde-forming)
VGAAVGLGYAQRDDGQAIDSAWLQSGRFEVDLAGVRLKAKVGLSAPYDPTGARIKG